MAIKSSFKDLQNVIFIFSYCFYFFRLKMESFKMKSLDPYQYEIFVIYSCNLLCMCWSTPNTNSFLNFYLKRMSLGLNLFWVPLVCYVSLGLQSSRIDHGSLRYFVFHCYNSLFLLVFVYFLLLVQMVLQFLLVFPSSSS